MKLQIKDNGSWRNVVSFEPGRADAIKAAAAKALQIKACPRTSMRIVDGDTRVLSCCAPDFLWLAPA